MTSPAGSAGYRIVPHTADVIVEAWGPTREQCFAEAVAGMAATFVDPDEARPSQEAPFELPAPGDGGDEELLLALLDEAIFLLDTAGGVPVSAKLHPTADGGLGGTMQLAQAAETVGAVPKAVTRHGLSVRHDADGWSCTVIVDV